MWEEVSARVRAKECTSFIQCLSIFSSDVVRAPISCASLCDFTSQQVETSGATLTTFSDHMPERLGLVLFLNPPR